MCGVLAAIGVGMVLSTADATPPTLAVKQVFVKNSNILNGQIVRINATCPSGYVLTGGGFSVGASSIVYADAINSRTFQVAAGNFSNSATTTASSDVFCIKGVRNLSVKAAMSASQRQQLERQALESHHLAH